MEKEEIISDSKDIYRVANTDVLSHLHLEETGLSNQEIDKRISMFGKNKLKEVKGKPLILVFLANFTSMMALLLWASGIIAIIAEMPQLGIAVWCVNIINGLFSFWQEFQAGKATDALKNMLPSYARVVRNGEEQQILAEDLVPGDIVLVAEGDKISVDARLIEASDLQVDQSTLTGESNPVRKVSDAVLKEGLSPFEISNMIHAGTSVSSGTGKAVVIATAMETEFGKIADLTQNMEEELSPLQKELNVLTKQISLIALGIGVVFFVVSVFFVKDGFAKSFIFALGMIVAFIPEGLLPTVTLSLAMAVQRMSKEHALVKKLSAVETLGCTTVICSDKTGTLTQNEMTVSNLWTVDGEYDVTGLGYAPEGNVEVNGASVNVKGNKDLDTLIRLSALCNNAKILPPSEESDRYTVLGDPTEACLSVVAQKSGYSLEEIFKNEPRLRELPFDSSRKRMTTVHQSFGERLAYVKGAPKEVMELSNKILVGGMVRDITESERQEIMEANDSYARKGLRVLAFAYRNLNEVDNLPKAMSAYTPELIEEDLVFVGLMAMSDPARPEVKDAVELCHKASIRIIMITGDYGLTAESIAKQIGIVHGENPRVITGKELYELSDEQLQEALEEEVIFARVAPEQKYRVVSCLQTMDHIVAVTGDGVNDAPALKRADIGVAMGITGTDVAKEAADVILTDDNFASIVKAVEEGRTVYSNIRKFLTYILNSNMSEAVPSAAFLFSRGGIPLPLTVMQILAIDLGTDMLPALGLGTELPEAGIMNVPPRSRDDSLLNKKTIIKAFFWYGLIASIIAMACYFYINFKNGYSFSNLAADGLVYRQATTMTLAAIVFCQIGAVLNCRTEKQSVFKMGIFSNKKVLIGIVFEIFLMAFMMYVPFMQSIFDTAPLGVTEWIILAIIPIPVFLIEEYRKKIVRNKVQKEEQ